MVENQRTLKSQISISGVGLHTGAKVNVTIHPAEANHGYKFQRLDVEGQPIIPADANLVVSTERGTTLEKEGIKVHTTEHILAALYGLQVDNALIQLDGPELPIMDGSSQPFVEKITSVGYQEQDAEREYLVLDENITFEIEDKGIEMLAVPYDEFRVTVMVDYHSPILGTQHASMYHLEEFENEIAPCRTFVFLRELEYLAKNGLIKGGDIDNAIVLVDNPNLSNEKINELKKLLGKEDLDVEIKGIGVLNNTKLKFINEPARHKLLDIVGDLALVGKPIKGHILSARPGHFGNVSFAKILKKLIKKPKNRIANIDLTKKPVYDINDISNMLPHKPPFLLVDKILEIEENAIIGLKNVTMNEPFFVGHFPGNPVMPGVLQIEAMAQTGGIFALEQVDEPSKYMTYFLKIDNVKFKKKVLPGDTLIFELVLASPIRRGIVHMNGKAYVNGEVACEAEMLAQIVKEN